VITEEEWELLRCPRCNDDLRPHVLWFDESYDEKYYKLNIVLRISEETGILFILGTSGATTLPRRVTENVLAHSGMVVEVNIDETYFSDVLVDKKNGIIIRESSSSFLTKLKNEIQQMVL
jgi:NAD-dependent deacetylase